MAFFPLPSSSSVLLSLTHLCSPSSTMLTTIVGIPSSLVTSTKDFSSSSISAPRSTACSAVSPAVTSSKVQSTWETAYGASCVSQLVDDIVANAPLPIHQLDHGRQLLKKCSSDIGWHGRCLMTVESLKW